MSDRSVTGITSRQSVSFSIGGGGLSSSGSSRTKLVGKEVRGGLEKLSLEAFQDDLIGLLIMRGDTDLPQTIFAGFTA